MGPMCCAHLFSPRVTQSAKSLKVNRISRECHLILRGLDIREPVNTMLMLGFRACPCPGGQGMDRETSGELADAQREIPSR